MTGNAKAMMHARKGWFPSLTQGFRSYVAVDGGSGAHLLAALAEYDPSFQQAASPRHANVLLLIEPIARKLLPAVKEVAATLARPFQVVIIGEADEVSTKREGITVRLEELFPNARRVMQASPETILALATQHVPTSESGTFEQPQTEATTIELPQRQELELATELAVLSVGPVQPFTAGPLRLFLICDGEQVFSAQVDAGYAHRGIEQSMLQADWSHGLALARQLDPLAPLAGQLAYVHAVEQVQRWQAPRPVAESREAALALERVQNVLWWSVRFAHMLDENPLTQRLYQLAQTFTEQSSSLWRQSPAAWLLPQYQVSFSSLRGNIAAISRLGQVAKDIEALRESLGRNRFLALRTRNVGVLAAEFLKMAGVSGSILRASEEGAGDVQSRFLARLQGAALDLREALEILSHTEAVSPHVVQWDVPAGEAEVTVAGPRGTIGLHIVSDGGERPTHVIWQRPSTALLPLLPDILKGQKLADAEVIVASLDLAMAEADG